MAVFPQADFERVAQEITNRKVGVAEKAAAPLSDQERGVSKDLAEAGLTIRRNAKIGVCAGQSRLWMVMAPLT